MFWKQDANLFQWEFPACSNRMSWKQWAEHKREAARCMRERLLGKQIESCTLGALQARSEEHLKHPDRWLLFEQLLFVPKHVTLPEKTLNCQERATQNQWEGVWHASTWRDHAFSSWKQSSCPIRAAFYLLQSMWPCRSRWVCVASQHSSVLFDQKTVHDKNSNGDIGGFPNWNWKNSKQSLSISEHCKKTTHHTKWPSPIFLNLSRASCMCGRVDINWVTVMPAGGRHVNSNLFQWVVLAYSNWICWKE